MTIDEHRLDALVAWSKEDRAQALMECASLGDNEGMLCVHDASLEACLGMKNTPLDLAIAFADDHGVILMPKR